MTAYHHTMIDPGRKLVANMPNRMLVGLLGHNIMTGTFVTLGHH